MDNCILSNNITVFELINLAFCVGVISYDRKEQQS